MYQQKLHQIPFDVHSSYSILSSFFYFLFPNFIYQISRHFKSIFIFSICSFLKYFKCCVFTTDLNRIKKQSILSFNWLKAVHNYTFFTFSTVIGYFVEDLFYTVFCFLFLSLVGDTFIYALGSI